MLVLVKQWYYQCEICGSKKSRFINNQEAKGQLSNPGLRTSLSTSIRWYFVLNAISLNATPLRV